MILATELREKYKNKLPSIVHVDGTVRPQSKNYKTNKKFLI